MPKASTRSTEKRSSPRSRAGDSNGADTRTPMASALSSVVTDTAELVFTHLDAAFTRVGEVGSTIQREHRKWAAKPPLDSNRQTRFLNKIDEWTAELGVVVRQLEAAEDLGRSLPELAKCNPKERAAKKLLAGLRALRTTEMLRQLLDTLRTLANRARQPMSAGELSRMWTEFADCMLRLVRALDEVREIKKLIASIREQFLTQADKSALASRQASYRITSIPLDHPIVGQGERVSGSLDKLEKAVDILSHSLGLFVREEVKRSQEAEIARSAFVAQQDDVLLAFANVERQIDLFKGRLEADDDCRELMSGHPDPKLSRLCESIKGVILSFEERLANIRLWMRAITYRESAVFSLPADVPNKLGKVIDGTHSMARKLHRMWARFSTTPSGTVAASRKIDFSRCEPDQKRILQHLVTVAPSAPGGHTVLSVAESLGLHPQKVRRVLLHQLGVTGLGVVARNPQDHLRSKENKSPQHVFSIDPEQAAAVREFLQSEEKTT